MDTTSSLISDIERAAAALAISPSTVGERAGQGGRFYQRLKDGARVWPETAQKVRDWIKTNEAGSDQSRRSPDPAASSGAGV